TAPPGDYMLFIVDSNGVPSVAPFVRFAAPYEDSQPPAAPANLTANAGSGQVALSWSPAADNVGVTKYNVYRSTVHGFTPGVQNLLAPTTSTSFTDNGMPPGTYYYAVTAVDAAGNVGAPSGEAV